MIFQNFQTTDVVSGRIETVTTGLWSNGAPIVYNFYTNSVQIPATDNCSPINVLNGAYYVNVYDLDPSTDVTAQVQFSISYGNLNGYGSLQNLNEGSTNVSRANYTTYKNILLNPNVNYFNFPQNNSISGFNSQDIYVINFSILSFKENLDAGVIQFNLSGSNGNFSFIDNSSTYPLGTSGQVYNIVSGSLANGIYSSFDSASGTGFGLFYPDVGIIVLNPTAIANTVGSGLIPNYGTDAYYQNHLKVFTALRTGAYFQARSSEYIPSTAYFVRVGNQNFNFSNNPTFVTGSSGTLLFPQFSSDPQVFVTTVGLYDDNNNLLAVAKLSQPQLKTFDNELLIKCKLNF